MNAVEERQFRNAVIGQQNVNYSSDFNATFNLDLVKKRIKRLTDECSKVDTNESIELELIR